MLELDKIIELYNSSDISNKIIACELLVGNPDIYESVPSSEIVRFYTAITGLSLNKKSPRVKDGSFTLEGLFRMHDMNYRKFYMLSWMGYYSGCYGVE